MTGDSNHGPTPGEDHHRKRGPVGQLRANFLTGLIVVLPIGLTVWLAWSAIGWIDGWILPLIPAPYQPQRWIGWNIPGVGLAIFLVFTVIIGWVAKGLIGRSLIRWGESVVARMPIVRSVYNGLKQIAETVFAQSESNFDHACLLEYPRKGMWGVGFVSTKAKGEIAEKIPDEEILTVFVPTTPNPTSGFLLYVPRRDVILLDRLSVEDAAKLIISAGLVYPADRSPEALPPAAKE